MRVSGQGMDYLRCMLRDSMRPNRASILAFWLLAAFLTILWVAGGASRSDVFGQVVVRFSAWLLILVAVLVLPRLPLRLIGWPALILGGSVVLVAVQLLPLPSSMWTQLPGRSLFSGAAIASGSTAQPWRPLSISPSGTLNALASLGVPASILLFAAHLNHDQHWRILKIVLGLIGAGAVLGILQFSGADLDNPFINNALGDVSGNFANRNHFALFLAIGCVLAPAVVLRGSSQPWKFVLVSGLVVLFVLTLLATGSRSGIVLGALGLASVCLGLRRQISDRLKVIPRKLVLPVSLTALGLSIGAVFLSVQLGRAFTIDRVSSIDAETDLRLQIWPVVLDMAWAYLPVGTGFGVFDPVFRISEPDVLLNPRYINQAHNDFLQVFLDGGVFGLIVLLLALGWFVRRSCQIWFSARGTSSSNHLAKVGSIVIALVVCASLTDYPARTPIVMALVALASVWLSRRERPK